MKRTESDVYNDIRDYLDSKNLNFTFDRVQNMHLTDSRTHYEMRWVLTVAGRLGQNKTKKVPQRRFIHHNLEIIEKELKDYINSI